MRYCPTHRSPITSVIGLNSKGRRRLRKHFGSTFRLRATFSLLWWAKTQLSMDAIVGADLRIWRDSLLKEGRSGTTVNDLVRVISFVALRWLLIKWVH